MDGKKRIDYYDVLKGAAIVMVVMGHVITMCIRDIDNCFLFKLISQTHMPLFFFISGYFSYKTLKAGDGEPVGDFLAPDLWRRFRQLIVPGVAVCALWMWYFPHSGLRSPLDTSIAGTLYSTFKSGYWFPWVLFALFVIYAVLSFVLRTMKSAMREVPTVVMAWALLILAENCIGQRLSGLLSLEIIVMYFPIFFAGVFAKKYERVFTGLVDSGAAQGVAIIVGAVSFYLIAYPWEFGFMTRHAVFLALPVYHIAIVLIFTALAKSLSAVYAESRVKKAVVYVGRKSLAVYLLHYFFLFPLTSLQEPLINLGLGITPVLTVAAVVSAIVIVETLIVNRILSLSPILSMLLTGDVTVKK